MCYYGVEVYDLFMVALTLRHSSTLSARRPSFVRTTASLFSSALLNKYFMHSPTVPHTMYLYTLGMSTAADTAKPFSFSSEAHSSVRPPCLEVDRTLYLSSPDVSGPVHCG